MGLGGNAFGRLCCVLTIVLILASCQGEVRRSEDETIRLSVLENAIRGGKNSFAAEWISEFVIPQFEQQMEREGKDVNVRLLETGIDDEDYKAAIALDLKQRQGADVIACDQFWLAEFAAENYLRPLRRIAPEADEWPGWDQMSGAVEASVEAEGERYAIPRGIDGRVLFYNRRLFARAGLPQRWQPRTWNDIIRAGRKLKRALPGVVPLQFNAGTPMGEATTLQGFIPILLGTGKAVYDPLTNKWLGASPELIETLSFFDTIYKEKLGDARLQMLPDGRDRSFKAFSEGKIAVLAEGDYFWRNVLNPKGGLFPMENRNQVVRWAKIPAQRPGSGIRNQDFVSASGGTAHVLNPHTKHPAEAWALISFMNSEEALSDFVKREPRITARQDVNRRVVAADPLLNFVANEILPITWFRPGFPEYARISTEITQMVESVIADRASVEAAARRFESRLGAIVGRAQIQSDRL